MSTFHKRKFRGYSFDYYSMIKPCLTKESVPSHSVIYSHQVLQSSWKLWCKVSKCHLNTWLHHLTCRNGRTSVWCILITFGESSLRESHAMTFSICHVTTWPKFMTKLMSLLYHFRKIWSRYSTFLKLCLNNKKNWYFKVR